MAAEDKRLLVLFRGTGGGGFSWSSYDFVVMPGFLNTWVCGTQNIGLFPHELGHYFGLSHTHGRKFDSVEEAASYFLARGSDPAVFDADKGTVTDTPGYPRAGIQSCDFDQKAVVIAGHAFPLARRNAMSYLHDDHPRTFSRQQAERIRSTLQTRVDEGRLKVEVLYHESAEKQLFGAVYQTFRAHYDGWWPERWRLALLDVHVLKGYARYTGVFRPLGGSEIQAYRWSETALRARYDELWPNGWRLHALESEYVSGRTRYTAVWRRAGNIGEIQVYGWNYASFRAKYDELWPDGWRLHLLDTHERDGSLRYTAVWRQLGNLGEYQRYGSTYAAFRAHYDELWPDGWRLHRIDTEAVGGQIRYTAVWRHEGDIGEYQLYGARYAEVRERYDELWPGGWRLHQLSSCVVGDEPRYTAVWRREPAAGGHC